jgi:hypothetical protein
MNMIPDAVIRTPGSLTAALEAPLRELPLLERLMYSDKPLGELEGRIHSENCFNPAAQRDWVKIDVLGRMFSGYHELDVRRSWSPLTESIHNLKDAVDFPGTWINAIRTYLERQPAIRFNARSVFTVVPAKPNRTPRLEHLLGQVERSHNQTPIAGATNLSFASTMAYRDGVRSHNRDHLGRDERFANVRDHLYVLDGADVRGKSVFVIDDVATSGASLFYAQRYLLAAGARAVRCLSLSKAISP